MTTVSRPDTPPPDGQPPQPPLTDGAERGTDGHPPWCDGRESPSAPHGVALPGVDAGQVVFSRGRGARSVDLFQHGQQPPTVVLGVYERRHTQRHRLTIDRAAELRDALTAAVDLTQPAA